MYDLQKMKERIKDLKNQIGLTNSELSELADIPVGTLNKMLGAETKDPQISTIIKIAKALGVSADYIILGSKNSVDETPSILIKYNKLNYIGQQKANEYIDDLLENSKYTERQSSVAEEKIRPVRIAAKGQGTFEKLISDEQRKRAAAALHDMQDEEE